MVAKGSEQIEANPYAMPLYNLACCESLAGHSRTRSSISAWRSSAWEGGRDLARTDSDFDAIRDEPGFRELVG